MTSIHFWLFLSIILTNIEDILSTAIIGNGEVILGLDEFGNLNIPYVGGVLGLPAADPTGRGVIGIRNGDGTFSATEEGGIREGWGVGFVNADTNISISVFVNNGLNQREGNVVSFTGTNGADSAISVVRDGVTNDTMEVIHSFFPSASSIYAMQVDVTIRNIGSENFDQTLYRRMMDWDPLPTPFNEFVTNIGTDAALLIYSSNHGICTSNPLEECFSGAFGVDNRTINRDFVDIGPFDQGATFDFDFGALAAGEEVAFTMYYGVAPGQDLAFQALSDVQAEVASLTKPNTSAAEIEQGLPFTFFFAFADVGGTAIGEDTVTAGGDDDDDGDDSVASADSSDSSDSGDNPADAKAYSERLEDEIPEIRKDDDDGNHEDVGIESVTVELSEDSVYELWIMLAVYFVIVSIFCLCYKRLSDKYRSRQSIDSLPIV